MSFKFGGNKTEKLTKIPNDSDRRIEEQVPRDRRCMYIHIYIYICLLSYVAHLI